MQAEFAEHMGLANLEFADWCCPFGQRAIHPYLWPEEPEVRKLPRLISPNQTPDALSPNTIAQLLTILRALPGTEMTTGLSLRRQLAPRERAALHIAAFQVLDQCFDDLTAAESCDPSRLGDVLAESLTVALLPGSFREALLAKRPYLHAKAYFCTLVAVCWKLAQHELIPLTNRAEREIAKMLCEAAARILGLASEPHRNEYFQTSMAASLLAAWQPIGNDKMDQTLPEQQKPPDAVTPTATNRNVWQIWFKNDMAEGCGQAAVAPHPYVLDQ
jgi:hypothetical protein